MILQELVKYYERLERTSKALPKKGFSKEKFGFVLVIDSNGEFVQLDDIRNPDKKKMLPVLLNVPSVQRTSGIKPAFLWDKAEYLFGVVSKEKKRLKTEEVPWEITPKSRLKFEAFRDYHRTAVNTCDNENLHSLVKFLDKWDPERFAMLEIEDPLSVVNSNLAVQIVDSIFVHDDVELIKKWREELNAGDNNERIYCLVTGKADVLATLHSGIKGVPGAQSSGAPLVSFNKESFCSYGKGMTDQGANAPVGERAAFEYGTVLNYLLGRESNQKVQVADTTILFWAEKDEKIEDIWGGLIDAGKYDDGSSKELSTYFDCVRSGKYPQNIDPSQLFYILGLSPNAARLSVRLWYVNTVQEISKQIVQHFEQLEIIRSYEKQLKYPGVWWLLIETATQHETKNIPPNLAGPFMMALLKGTPYPTSLLSLLLGRMRVDKDPNYYKCALIKAILIRNYNKEVSVSLDKNRTDVAYVLGRLFAVLEKIQEESAGGKINASIKDKYFASASTHPSVTFPLIIRLSQNHQKKLKSDKAGRAVFFQKELQDILANVENFPSYLNLEDQGMFAIGYYHQYQSFFVKKSTENNEEQTSTNIEGEEQ